MKQGRNHFFLTRDQKLLQSGSESGDDDFLDIYFFNINFPKSGFVLKNLIIKTYSKAFSDFLVNYLEC